VYSALRNALYAWLFQLRGPQAGPVVLVQRRIFILPSAQGYLFVGVLLLMLIGSINYALSLGFVLTFLLTGLGLNAMVYTFRNLARLQVSAGRVSSVFAGDTAQFTVHIENPTRVHRYAIAVTPDKRQASYVDVPARESATAVLRLPAPRRGRMPLGRLTLFTRYPLGLYYAWSYVELDVHCLVYPRPATARLPLPPLEAPTGSGTRHGAGLEDFSGMRPYQAGDSPRHIAWKAAARSEELLTKQFSGRADAELWLDWGALPATLGVEERLAHLARWVLDAHGGGMTYGLRLPGRTLPPASGEAHRELCLTALALFEIRRE